MRRLFIFLILLFPWHFVFAKVPPPPYCEGHPRKVIDAGRDLVSTIQAELNRYDAPEYNSNNRYELCFEIHNSTGGNFVSLSEGQVFTLTNTTDKEVVIGFLNAARTDESTTPIIEVHGTKVTIFQPTFSNVKKAIVFDGNRHKLVGGTINGVANAGDSLCVDGAGNNIEIKDAVINDCVNAISLNGNRSTVQNVSIYPHQSDYVMRDLESDAERQTRILEGRRIWPSGVCLSLQGNDGAIRNTVLEKCYGVGIKVSGNRNRFVSNRVIGETPYADDVTKYSTDCFQLVAALNVNVESQELAHCQKGIHIIDSQSIHIGPERFEDFAAKKNDIHHNDYAIHAERSQMVYARHNQVYENGFETQDRNEMYRFGFWPVESNLIFNGESQVLPSPKFDPVQGETNDEEYPVVKYDAQNNAFIDIKIPVQTGKLELSFPYNRDSQSNVQAISGRDRHQPHTPFTDCSFENATSKSQAPIGKGDQLESGTYWYTVRCPIQVTNEIKGKRLLAILHGNPVGSSQYAKALGIINDPTGVPVSGPAPTTGNMSGAGAGQAAGEALAGGAHDNVSPAGGAPGCGGSIAGEKTMKGYFVLWYIVLTILLGLRVCHRKRSQALFARRHLWTK